MALNVIRPLFNPFGPFVVRAGFLYKGVNLKAGEPFAAENATSPRQLKILYESRKINLGKKLPFNEKVDWQSLDDESLLAHALDITGIHFRKVERAKRALADLA